MVLCLRINTSRLEEVSLRKTYDGNFRIVRETTTDQHYPIRPAHIQEQLLGTFGKAEVEWAAEKLITFFKNRGFWTGFTLEELSLFYKQNGWDIRDILFGLLGKWFDDAPTPNWYGAWRDPADVFVVTVIAGNDDMLCVTDRFIERCASACHDDTRATPST